MIHVTINNKPTVTSATNVQELVDELGLPDRGVAVAIANRMVPRSQWEEKVLKDDDSITIIKAAFGG